MNQIESFNKSLITNKSKDMLAKIFHRLAIIFSGILLFISPEIKAQSLVNKLYIPVVECGPGRSATLPVYLNNETGVVAVQFNVKIPVQFSVPDKSQILLSDRKADHTLSIKSLGNNEYTIMGFSLTNAAFLGNSGVLIRIPVNIPDTCLTHAEYPVTLSKVVLSNQKGENIVTNVQSGAIKIITDPRPDIAVQDIQSSATNIIPGEKITISWNIKNIGDLITSGGWSEQVSLISDNGDFLSIGTLHYDQLVAAGGLVSRQIDYMVPKNAGIDGKVKIMIKAIPSITLGELPSAQFNNTAKSTDYYTVDKKLFLTINKTVIAENDPSLIMFQLFRSGSRTTEQTFEINTVNSGRLNIPATVTIAANSSGVVFYASVIDNQVLNIDSTVTITAKGNSYPDAVSKLRIEDNEIPKLFITASKQNLNEGDVFQLTIERELVTAYPLKVTLSTDLDKRFIFEKDIIIPANVKSTTINITTLDDDIPALTVNPTFSAVADGYTNGLLTFSLADNDLPLISMSLTPVVISESAGYQASIGVLKRQGSTENTLTVKLSDNSNGVLYYSASTIVFEKGVSEKQFTIGVVDNGIVDGNKNYEITAAVFLSSCGCNATGSDAGIVKVNLQVLDDDGPALKITSSQTVLSEGKQEATILTVTRNTSTEQTLDISIASDRDDELNYNKTVTIPVGSTSVDIPVATKANSVTEGDRTVVFTATAETYTKGVCWAMISDQTLPDAVVNVNSISSTDVVVKQNFLYEIQVKNTGISALAANTMVSIYLSNENILSSSGSANLLKTIYTKTTIPAGNSETLSGTLQVPDFTGQFFLITKVNNDQAKKELSYLNNVSNAKQITILPLFTATLNVEKTTYKQGETVGLSGQTTSFDGTVLSGVDVEVYVSNNGFIRRFSAKTDNTGAFRFSFIPYSGQTGHFTAGACYPGEGLNVEQASFDIYGLKRTTTDNLIWDVLVDEEMSGEIEIANTCNLPLSGLKVNVVSNPVMGLQIQFNDLPDLTSGESTKIKYTLKGNTPSSSNQYDQIKFHVVSNEGAILDMIGYFYCRSPKASLKASLTSIQTTMVKGEVRTYQFTITNIGKAPSGKISINLPSTQWLSLITPVEMSSLAFGESASVILQFAPGNDMIAHTSVNGTIGVNCENGSGFPLLYNIEVVSEKTGALTIDVCDEYTYYTSEAPHLAGAKVVVKHPFTGVIVAQGFTDNKGLCNIPNLPEGYYTLSVTADKHDSYNNTIIIDPSRTTKILVNLSFRAITYTWNVEETTVEDVYNIETTVKYETNVPVPVVEVKYPDNLTYNNQVFNIIVTNKGLISAKDVTVDIPVVDGVKFEFLTTNPIDELKPQQSNVISVLMTILDENQNKVIKITENNSTNSLQNPNRIKSSETETPTPKSCITIILKTIWYWRCGDITSDAMNTYYQFGECVNKFISTTPIVYTGNTSSGGDNPIGNPNSGNPNSNYTGTSVGISPTLNFKDCHGDYYRTITESDWNSDEYQAPQSSFELRYKTGYLETDYAKRHAIKGVVADGVSSISVLIRNIPKEAVTYSITLSSDYGSNREVCGHVNNSSGLVYDLENNLLIYTAPTEYPESAPNEYNVYGELIFFDAYGLKINYKFLLDVTPEGYEITANNIPISIIRPPVLFVHGLNSDNLCFDDFREYLLDKTDMYSESQLLRVDYEPTNKAHFADNTSVISSYLDELFLKQTMNGYVATKADFVGHSMGGILSRLYVQMNSNKNVHKIITLNTPHSGSQIANFIMNNPDNFIYQAAIPLFNNDFRAISDLQVGSNAIENLLNDKSKLDYMNNVPIFSLTTTVTIPSEEELRNQFIKYEILYNFLKISIVVFKPETKSFFKKFDKAVVKSKEMIIEFYKILDDFTKEIYGEPTDIIVALSSQQGGINNTSNIPGSIFQTFHSKSTDFKPVHEKLMYLLSLPESSLEFCKTGFHPVKITYTGPVQTTKKLQKIINSESETSFIKIDSLVLDDFNNLKTSMSFSDNTKNAILIGTLNDNTSFSTFNEQDTIKIPDTYRGVIKIYALSETESGVVFKDSSVVMVQNYRTSPVKIQFDEEKYYAFKDSAFIPRVKCTWLDGSITYVDATLSIDSESAAINGKYVKGLKEGRATLKASFEGLDYEIPLIVLDKEKLFAKSDVEKENSVCSSISLQFSQTMSMTRQAFRGTLSVFNGHDTEAMKNVKLSLEIKDSNGTIVGSRIFQVNTESVDKLTAIDGTGVLNAQQTGTATILFIPTKYAAPLISQVYSFGGTLSYFDPFTQTVVTRNLYPVTLTVNPSPDLTLTYFMQRDVIGDDPLTLDIVEPKETAEFSLLIKNVGGGDATNVKFATNQPQVIQNDKGLLNEFLLTGSSLNGEERTLNFSNNYFGKIPAGKTAYAQWWFTSSLTGHFTEYDTKLTHVTSYDNPDLSLVSDLSIHELIRSVDIPGYDNSALKGFLVNDVKDAFDLPDMLYLTDGIIEEVSIAQGAEFTKLNEDSYLMKVTRSLSGWNYGQFDDPASGKQKLVNVIRQSDNKSISLRNFWLTDRTLRDGKEQLYENKIHFVDNLSNLTETYILSYDTKIDTILQVSEFKGVPDSISKTPVTKVNVIFNKPIDISTFSIDDISLTCQGNAVDISEIKITHVNTSEFIIDFTNATNLNGFYVLTVQCRNISDAQGYSGETGRQISWTQFDGDIILNLMVQPTGSGSIVSGVNYFSFGVPAFLKASPNNGYYFKNWTIDENIISTDSLMKYLPSGNKTLVANFDTKNYFVKVSFDNKQGNATGNSSGIYSFGSAINLNAIANEEYTFMGWKVNGVIVDKNSSYNFTVTDNVNIEAVFGLTSILTELQVVQSKEQKMIVFPNPTNNNLGVNIKLNSYENENAQLVITTIIGTVVKTENIKGMQMHISNLQPGLYIFNLRINGINTDYIKVVVR